MTDTETAPSPELRGETAPWVEVYYDGACPLCSREIRFLARRDRHRRIRFTDIADPDFDAWAETGRPLEVLHARIHGRLLPGRPDSRPRPDADPSGVLDGPDVFRELYSAIGWTGVVAVSRWPGIAQLLELGYQIFARLRRRLPGRCETGRCRR